VFKPPRLNVKEMARKKFRLDAIIKITRIDGKEQDTIIHDLND